jgi:hypothetical protein
MRHAPLLPRASLRLLVAVCGLALLLAAWLVQRPTSTSPAPAGAAARFDAGRALAHVAVLAQAPRPTGSAANARARAYLLARIHALGLTPQLQVQVQEETVHATTLDWMANAQVTLATVHNIVVRKPGVAHRADGSRPAVLAMARYDSGAATLGAADGSASAAALLETLRVLQAGPPLDNDLLFVFTDADSGQPLGTRAFVASHPWASDVRAALRFDNAGNRGPLELIDASHADGVAMAAWADAAPAPQGSSFMAALYERLPQHAPAAALAGAGFPVLQFATTQGTLGWDGMHDLPQRLSGASLQHEGDTMLALLRRLGTASLPAAPRARGQVFFALPLIGMVHYDARLAWPLAALACALTVHACRVALRRKLSGVDIIHAAFGFLFMGMAATFITYLGREALAGLQARYTLGVLVDDGGVAWQRLAFVLLPAAVFIPLQRDLQARLGVAVTALGVIAAASVALLAVCVLAPGASYVLAWPLLAAHAVWLAHAHAGTRARRVALLLAGALAVMAPMVPAMEGSIGFFSPAWLVLPAALVCTALGLCGMALAAPAPRFIVRPLLAAAGACVGLAYAATPQWPALPAPNHLVYYKDTPSWQAFWMYPPQPLDAWTRQVFPNTLHPYLLPYLFGTSSTPVWYAAAPRDDSVAWPDLLIEKDERNGRRRHVEFRLRSKNRAPEIVVRLDGAKALRTSVNGRVLTDQQTFSWKLTLHGMDDRDLRFAFDFDGDPSFTVFIQERMPGVPLRDLPPRPSGLPPLLPLTGTTVAADVLVFR